MFQVRKTNIITFEWLVNAFFVFPGSKLSSDGGFPNWPILCLSLVLSSQNGTSSLQTQQDSLQSHPSIIRCLLHATYNYLFIEGAVKLSSKWMQFIGLFLGKL
jgi:hypothetical protein